MPPTTRIRPPAAPLSLDAEGVELWRVTYRRLHDAGLWRGDADRPALERYCLASRLAQRELALAATTYDIEGSLRGAQLMRDAAQYARDLGLHLRKPQPPAPAEPLPPIFA